jgi:hypothetical protein
VRVDHPPEPGLESERERAGLCADCRSRRLIHSDRGTTFYLCNRSTVDPRFPKYPRLPVIQCPGYERAAAGPVETTR